MTDDNLLPFSFPSVARKKVTADFDGGRLTSDGGVSCCRWQNIDSASPNDWHAAFPITAIRADMLRARIFAISCDYEDANDLCFLRADPAFRLACERLPDTGRNLCSQPTLRIPTKAPVCNGIMASPCNGMIPPRRRGR